MHPETPAAPTPDSEAETLSRLGQYLKKSRGEAEQMTETELLAAIYVHTLPRSESKGPSVGQRIMEQLAEISEAQVESLIRLDRLLTHVEKILNAAPNNTPTPAPDKAESSVSPQT